MVTGKVASPRALSALRHTSIPKSAAAWRVTPNLLDYDEERRRFSWDAARAALDGLPGGAGLNIAHEAVDRHAAGALAGFTFDFKNDDDFGFDMIEDRDDHDENERLSIEKRIAEMSVGKKIKLAFLGNKTVRGILIRDRSKQVAVAVVKGGRCTDAEVLAYAGNRNLPDDVLREIAMNKEWVRKYPVKFALASNPKCPASVAVGLVSALQPKDLATLSRNKNVSSVVFQMAGRLLRDRKH